MTSTGFAMPATLCPATLSRSRPRAGHLRQNRVTVAVTGRIREEDLDATETSKET